jgi:hypothetical protein
VADVVLVTDAPLTDTALKLVAESQDALLLCLLICNVEKIDDTPAESGLVVEFEV